MINVRVKLFARAKDVAGVAEDAFTLPDATTVAGLRQALVDRYPPLADILKHSALAVNEEFADDTTVLTDGAVVALLPPVSGG